MNSIFIYFIKLSDALKKLPNGYFKNSINHDELFLCLINELNNSSIKDDSRKLITKYYFMNNVEIYNYI